MSNITINKATLNKAPAALTDKPLIAPFGFREYDARWLLDDEINLSGMRILGLGLGTILHELANIDEIEANHPRIIVGHDFRAYSQSVKEALIYGLIETGWQVYDIGLALSPMAYFAQFALNVPCVAMVTASHNENGWTGVKMGAKPPLTFSTEEMDLLRRTVLESGLEGKIKKRAGGAYFSIANMADHYMADLTARPKLPCHLKTVIACGNGTAGAFAPHVLSAIGADIVPLHCELDHSFPHYNPNPESLKMLHDLRDKVLATQADIGFAFDGDGDRCGIVDNQGRIIFADKIGVLLARHFAATQKHARFIADIKSTGLFMSDPILKKHGAQTAYWKTGHSYMKRHLHTTKALAGFEKSGHFFFNAPIGRGYDDGILAALALCDMLAQNKPHSMADLYDSLPQTWSSPTMAPYCADDKKYDVVARATAYFEKCQKEGKQLLGQAIHNVVTVNGVRITLADGTWGLIRASSNKPSLVVVVESPIGEQNMRA
ncbi:MAG: phosphomannomutase/phosphoglucomutase, partial [Alphaproteobacteria bacterium]|nr:phosphomannomutase/phosphoglucomutase [Alphaproteobacteria bacterium]